MVDDPRTNAKNFLEASSIIVELEEILNVLVFEKPDDLHGFLANHFLGQSKQPKIANLILKQLLGPASESALHIDLTIALRNKMEKRTGLTVNLLSTKSDKNATKYIQEFSNYDELRFISVLICYALNFLVNSSSLKTLLSRTDLYDQTAIDELLATYRLNCSQAFAKILALEAENSNDESAVGTPTKAQNNTRAPPSASAAKGGAAPPSSKKAVSKDVQSIEILPDEPEPLSFPGQLLVTGISLTCLLITSEIQQSTLFRLLQLPSITNLSMPLPIIPILQSGPSYPGKQSIIKYFMLIPTPHMIQNEEWIYKVHRIIQFLRDTLTNTKGATLQSTFSTDDGCLVFPMDKFEQGFDLLQNAINSVCGADEHWFDYAIQMGPYETFDYIRGRYEVSAGSLKTPDELVDTYVEWLDVHPRCIMLIDPFRYADKPSLSRLCDRVSNKCYITSTDIRRYRNNNNNNNQDDINALNCHLLSLDSAPTMTEFIQQMNTMREANGYPLGLFERDHQEVAQTHLADFAVGLGCRFIKLPGLLSLSGQRSSSIIQRLSLIRNEIEANDGDEIEWLTKHEFIHIRSSVDTSEPERVSSPTPTNTKNKDKKKRS